MTGARIIEVWGSAVGPARRLSPQGRITTGALLLLVVMIVDPAIWPGMCLWGLVVASWMVATRPPKPLRGRLLVFGLVVLGPWFLLTPWIVAPASGASEEYLWIGGAWVVPWRLFFRGFGGLLVGAWTAATLPLPELSAGLAALPVPRAVAMILLQIVHRTHALAAETRGMMQAIRVRGAAGGLRSVPTIAAALPRVWMPRVIDRAERVGDAMEVRGFDSDHLDRDAFRWKASDAVGVGLSILVLGAAVAARVVLS